MQRSLRQSRVLFQSKSLPLLPASCIIQRPFRTSRIASRHRILPRTTQHVSYFHQHACRRQQAAAEAVEAQVEEQVSGSRPPSDEEINKQTNTGPITRFEELSQRGLVNDRIVDSLTKRMGLSTMTEVQSKTINEALTGVDVLAQAKTGTGKTIAFLLPILQNILTADPELVERNRDGRTYRSKHGASDVRAIVISPTRELAEQIAEEARKLVQGTRITVQTAVGGTQKSKHLRQMQMEGCHILVGTPGRLKDILSDRSTGVRAPRLSALVLDEADRLMDVGFWPEIEEIQTYLPEKEHQDRQTLLFSATVSDDVVQMVRQVMKPNLHYVKTVQNTEDPTHARVKQSLVHVAGFENQLPAVLELCHREIEAYKRGERSRPFKAIVYFNATAEAALAADILINIRQRNAGGGRAAVDRNDHHDTSILGTKTRIYSLHSRLTQSARTAAADYFRSSNTAILCSSDVTARGMDFPDVTHVIQVGLPPNRDSYIHRLGRTARAGREGEGWVILPSIAKRELGNRLGRMPLQQDKSLSTATVDMSPTDDGETPDIPAEASAYFDAVAVAAQRVDPTNFEKNYMAMLGTGQYIHDKELLIECMNRVARVQWGMSKPPAVNASLAHKLGLSRVRSLRTVSRSESDSSRPREVRDYGSRGPSGRDTRGRSPRSYDDSRGGRGDFGGGRPFVARERYDDDGGNYQRNRPWEGRGRRPRDIGSY